jgi:hypothetical protein
VSSNHTKLELIEAYRSTPSFEREELGFELPHTCVASAVLSDRRLQRYIMLGSVKLADFLMAKELAENIREII